MKFLPTIGTALSGSLGGIVASHNAGGAYFRSRVIPVNPGTAQQVAVRGFVADLTSRWANVLTQAQRDTWTDYAVNVLLPDRLGQERNISALAQYVRSNVPRLQAGLPRVDSAPAIFNLGEFTNPAFGTFAEATEDFAVTFDNTDEWANEDDSAMLVYGSRPVNDTINFFKGPYRFADKIDGDAVTAPTSPATIVNPFAFVAGQQIFVQVRFSRADGRLSQPFRGFGIGA